MIRSIIVENEKKHSQYLSAMLASQFPEVDVLGICESVPDGVAQIDKWRPELVFLDVELAPYTGFDLLAQVPRYEYRVIFTTSHNKYAVKAFEFCALDYLQKPYGLNELKRSIDRYKQTGDSAADSPRLETLLRNLRQSEVNELEIYIPVQKSEQKLRLGDIICCATGGGGITFNLVGGEQITISKVLNWVEERLSDYYFYRVHDSYLVNLHHVKKITHVRDGAELLLSDGKTVEVAKRRKAGFLEAIERRNVMKR